VATQVNVMTHVTRAKRERGATFVVVDPYRTGTAAQADIHLMVRPGTDGALAAAVMHVLFKEGFADRAYLARHTDASPALGAALAARPPEGGAAIPGPEAKALVASPGLHARPKRSFLRIGSGSPRSRNGAPQAHAAGCLPAVTGAWQHPGGGALYSNSA